MEQRLLSTGQVARILGLQTYQLEYAHSSRQLEEPQARFLGKRVYLLEDLKRVAQHFGVPFDEPALEKAEKEGL